MHPDPPSRLARWAAIGLALASGSACGRSRTTPRQQPPPRAEASRPEGPAPAALTDAQANLPFVVTMQQSYFGQNDFLLTLRSADLSGELVVSPQDSVACGARPIGRFRVTLPDTLFSRLAEALPKAPEPEDAFHLERDSTTVTIVVSRGSWSRRFVHFRADWQGVRPDEEQLFHQLVEVLQDGEKQIRLHPTDAIELNATRQGDRLVLEIRNVGTNPVQFAHPLHLLGDATVGRFVAVDSNRPIPFADRPDADPPPVTLARGQRYSLRSVPLPDVGGVVRAEWYEPGEPGEEEGVFRTKGCMRSVVP
jgi:hypothetical protein